MDNQPQPLPPQPPEPSGSLFPSQQPNSVAPSNSPALPNSPQPPQYIPPSIEAAYPPQQPAPAPQTQQVYGSYQPPGVVVPAAPPMQPDSQTTIASGSKSFLVAFLLSLFLGGLGADRFYLGKIGTGLLKLFTLGGFGVWSTIDVILVLANHTKAKDGTALQGYEENRKTAIIILVAWLLMCTAFGVYDILMLNKAVHTVSKISSSTFSCSGNSCTASPKQAPTAATTDTPFSQIANGSGDAASLAMKITGSSVNPPTTGEAPNAGMEYIEVDFSMTNSGKQSKFVPGTFYYQTARGTLLNDTGTRGSGPNIDSKNVQLVDKNRQPLIAVSLQPGQSDSSHYDLYQVPKGDVGKVIWFDGIYDTTSPKLAIFDLK